MTVGLLNGQNEIKLGWISKASVQMTGSVWQVERAWRGGSASKSLFPVHETSGGFNVHLMCALIAVEQVWLKAAQLGNLLLTSAHFAFNPL